MTMLKVGDIAPEISGLDQHGNTIRWKDFKGKKLILFFYPKDSTPGCTAEVCNLRDHYLELQNYGFNLLGVSADSVESHKKFAVKNNLPFSLLADTDKAVLNGYGVWGPKKFMGRVFDGIHRTTFVVDEKGKIEQVITKVDTKDHANQILKNLNLV